MNWFSWVSYTKAPPGAFALVFYQAGFQAIHFRLDTYEHPAQPRIKPPFSVAAH
jgi:hypothetical protein